MTESRWTRIESLFHGALEHPPEQREAWLQARCQDDPELLQEVLDLLAADSGDRTDILGHAVAGAARALETSQRLDRNQQLGSWRIREELGSGGMGSVYLAERADQEYRQQVAIKVIRGFPESQALARLRRERQILANLNHPNIAGLIDGGTTVDGQPYLVMEYVEGVPVDQWCRDQGLDTQACLELFREICEAVHYAHQHLVIHRDIKPGNVLVTPEGRPILLDFGIAKLVEHPDDMTGTEATRAQAYATPYYASPEQLEGRPVSTASDIYALGMLLLTLLDFPPDNEHTRTDPRQRSRQRADWRGRLPRDLAAIIEQATRPEPSGRYASVSALAADIGRYLDNRPVEAVPDRFGYRARRFVSRHRAGVAATAIAIVIGIGLVTALIRGYELARTAESRANLEAETANRVADFMISMFQAADPRVARGEDIPVSQLLVRGREQLDREQYLPPRLRARMLLALGEVNRYMENDNEAEALLREAVALYDGPAGPAPANTLKALSLLGTTLIRRGDPRAAEPPLSRALAMVEDGTLDNPLQQSEAYNQWGLLQLELGHYEDALDYLERALKLRRAGGGDAENVSASLHNMANAHYARGRIGAALIHLNEAIDMKTRALGRTHPATLNSLNLMAIIHRKQGNFEDAREIVDEILSAYRKLYGPDHPALNNIYNELAMTHHDLGDYEAAISNYTRSLELARRKGGDTNMDAVITLNNLALAHADRGDPETAEDLLRQSLELRTELLGPEHPSTDHARYNLGRLLLDTGRLDEAAPLLDQVLRYRRRNLEADHSQILRARLLRAELHRRRGDVSALADMDAAVALLRDKLPSGNLTRQSVLRRYGRNLIESDNLPEARRYLVEARDELVSTFGRDHTLVAMTQLELAWLERLEGNAREAEALIDTATPVLQARLLTDSSTLRQADCLRQGTSDPKCWMPRHGGTSANTQG